MRKLLIILTLLLTVTFAGIMCSCNKSPYALEYGVYGFESAVLTNRITKVVEYKDSDDIFNDKEQFDLWNGLFDFMMPVDEDTEYFRLKDKRVYVLNEGLAFEVVGENTLELHFPYWSAGYYSYDVKLTLKPQIMYK